MGVHETKWYTVYEADGDKVVVIGFVKDCAAFLNMDPSSFRAFVSRVKNGVIKTHTIAVEDLAEEGSYTVYGAQNTGRITRGPTIDYEMVEELYHSGVPDAEICRQLNIAPERVWYWRKKNNLPAIGKRGRKKKCISASGGNEKILEEAG